MEIIDSAEKWKKLREIRNLLTHTYPWERSELISSLRIALDYSETLIRIYINVKDYLRKRGLKDV